MSRGLAFGVASSSRRFYDYTGIHAPDPCAQTDAATMMRPPRFRACA